MGEEDVVNNRTYTATVKCLSTKATLLMINAEEFIIKFGKDDVTWKMITERVLNKDIATKSTIKKFILNMKLHM